MQYNLEYELPLDLSTLPKYIFDSHFAAYFTIITPYTCEIAYHRSDVPFYELVSV